MDSERFERAIVLRDAGEEENALRELEALAGLTSDAHEKSILILNQANCLWRLSRLTEARERLSEAARTGSTPFTEFLDACICVTEGKSAEAVRKLRLFVDTHSDLKASEHGRVYFDAQDELGRLLFNLERYAEAVDPLKEALMLAEAHYHKALCFYLGVCYFHTGRLREAEEKLLQSLPASPADSWWVQAKYQLGCVYFAQGSYLNAKKSFEICAFYLHDAHNMKENVSAWLVETRRKLGERDVSIT